MSLPHFGVLKIAAWIATSIVVLGLAAAAEMKEGTNPIIWVALIMGTSSLLVAIITGFFSLKIQTRVERKVDKVDTKVDTVEKNTNDKLTKLLEEKSAAATRADRAEAFMEGSEAERTKRGDETS